MATTPIRITTHATRCYACDARPTGIAWHNGEHKHSCPRHSDPTLRAVLTCYVCASPVRAGSMVEANVDHVHRACYRRVCAY